MTSRSTLLQPIFGGRKRHNAATMGNKPDRKPRTNPHCLELQSQTRQLAPSENLSLRTSSRPLLPGVCQASSVHHVVATFRVARLTSQTRKRWLVDVATDRDARHAHLRFFSIYCFLFFFCQHKRIKNFEKYKRFFFFSKKKTHTHTQKKKRKEKEKEKKKKRPSGVPPETVQKIFFSRNGTRNRAAIEAKKLRKQNN